MERENSVYCPHCRKTGPPVWVGFGRDWVLCSSCQRRLLWSEVRAWRLVSEELKVERSAAAYH